MKRLVGLDKPLPKDSQVEADRKQVEKWLRLHAPTRLETATADGALSPYAQWSTKKGKHSQGKP